MGDVVKLLPFSLYQEGEINKWCQKHNASDRNAADLYYKEYNTIIYTITDDQILRHTSTIRTPYLEVLNNKSADIIQFKERK